MSVDDRVDISPNAEEQQRITDAVTAIVERRATIQCAMGMLMVIYDVNDEQAFDMLKSLSQHDNVKLRILAQRLTSELPAKVNGLTGALRSECDRILAHHDAADLTAPPETMC